MKSSLRKKTKPKRHELNGINMGSEQELYELRRHAILSGAGSVSQLLRTLNNQLKPRYRDTLTMLEQRIIDEARDGNNEVLGLHAELKQEFDGLKADTIKCAARSLASRGHLIEATRGGKTEGARGAVVKCYFPRDHKLGSNFSIATTSNNYEGGED